VKTLAKNHLIIGLSFSGQRDEDLQMVYDLVSKLMLILS
jgi:hypothetical protein